MIGVMRFFIGGILNLEMYFRYYLVPLLTNLRLLSNSKLIPKLKRKRDMGIKLHFSFFFALKFYLFKKLIFFKKKLVSKSLKSKSCLSQTYSTEIIPVFK